MNSEGLGMRSLDWSTQQNNPIVCKNNKLCSRKYTQKAHTTKTLDFA